MFSVIKYQPNFVINYEFTICLMLCLYIKYNRKLIFPGFSTLKKWKFNLNKCQVANVNNGNNQVHRCRL